MRNIPVGAGKRRNRHSSSSYQRHNTSVSSEVAVPTPNIDSSSHQNFSTLESTPSALKSSPPEFSVIYSEASKQANETCNNERWEGGLPNIALGFAYKKAKELDVPTVVGLSQLREVHENIRVWRELDLEDQNVAKKRAACEQSVLEDFKEVQGWSWVSP